MTYHNSQSMIVQVSVVLIRTVCGDIDRRLDNLNQNNNKPVATVSGSHHHS